MTNKKQAIVMVHGMGEQRPMETLHSFVESVWTKDPAAQGNTSSSKFKEKVWTIPDSLAGLQELRRVSTPENRDGKRTDFYEFYWADIMQGTTLQHVWAWIRGLLIRPPNTVPGNVFLIWITLWIITSALGFFAFVWFLNIEDINSFICARGTNEWVCAALQCLNKLEAHGLSSWVYVKKAILWLIPIIVLYEKFSAKAFLSWKVLPSLALLIVTLPIINSMMNIVIFSGNFMIVCVSGVGVIMHSLLVKYFGDVARFVRATPENVQKRKEIRDRGLALLKGLHQSGQYDRIIVVAHSQGTIVAYDLLSLLWSEIGPSSHNLPSKKSAKALSDLDSWLAAVGDGKKEWKLGKFQDYQRSISKELAAQHSPDADASIPIPVVENRRNWLVSDFITIGSPLTHAEFLLAKDLDDLDRLIEQRALPISPPQLEASLPTSEKSFRYADNATGQKVPHHAAMFSAVRWTNIYDKPHPIWFLCGDPVSGPIDYVLGNKRLQAKISNDGKSTKGCAGISDQKVVIRRSSKIFPRFFTHTLYWKWHHKWNGQTPPHHIRVLRDAVNINDD